MEFEGNLQCSWSWYGQSPYRMAGRGRKELCIQGLVVQDLALFVVQVSGSLEINFLNLSPTILVHLGFQLVINALDPQTLILAFSMVCNLVSVKIYALPVKKTTGKCFV